MQAFQEGRECVAKQREQRFDAGLCETACELRGGPLRSRGRTFRRGHDGPAGECAQPICPSASYRKYTASQGKESARATALTSLEAEFDVNRPERDCRGAE